MSLPSSLPHARRRLASALGAAGRMLWRRRDLEAADLVIADLLAEALVRLGHALQPVKSFEKDGAINAATLLRFAPTHLRREVGLLVDLATRQEPVAACVQRPEATFKSELKDDLLVQDHGLDVAPDSAAHPVEVVSQIDSDLEPQSELLVTALLRAQRLSTHRP